MLQRLGSNVSVFVAKAFFPDPDSPRHRAINDLSTGLRLKEELPHVK
jgi:hypothetical protein